MLAQRLGQQFGALRDRDRVVEALGERLDAEGLALTLGERPDVVLGALGLARVRRRQATNRGAALTGVILGALATVAAILWTVFVVWAAQSPLVQECAQPGLTPEQAQACVEENLGQP